MASAAVAVVALSWRRSPPPHPYPTDRYYVYCVTRHSFSPPRPGAYIRDYGNAYNLLHVRCIISPEESAHCRARYASPFAEVVTVLSLSRHIINVTTRITILSFPKYKSNVARLASCCSTASTLAHAFGCLDIPKRDCSGSPSRPTLFSVIV